MGGTAVLDIVEREPAGLRPRSAYVSARAHEARGHTAEGPSRRATPGARGATCHPAGDPLDRLVGRSPAMVAVRERLRKIAASRSSTVLLIGESGTGKDVAARAIHDASARAAAPFMNVTCSALPETLLESELFGHERGAFTDAKRQKKGLLELADGGTVFLDEIAETSPPLQAKLLRFLEEKAFKRVGGAADVRVDVRVIAATHRDLAEAVRRGAFRHDLYYRLNVLPVRMPALRDRPGDLPLLVEHCIATLDRELGRGVRGVTPEAMARLEAHPWPGNVRELRNVIERAMVLAEGDRLGPDDFPLSAYEDPAAPPSAAPISLPPEGIDLKRLERELVGQALARCAGNQTRAAALLGMNRDQMRYRIEKFGLLESGASTTFAGAAVPTFASIRVFGERPDAPRRGSAGTCERVRQRIEKLGLP